MFGFTQRDESVASPPSRTTIPSVMTRTILVDLNWCLHYERHHLNQRWIDFVAARLNISSQKQPKHLFHISFGIASQASACPQERNELSRGLVQTFVFHNKLHHHLTFALIMTCAQATACGYSTSLEQDQCQPQGHDGYNKIEGMQEERTPGAAPTSITITFASTDRTVHALPLTTWRQQHSNEVLWASARLRLHMTSSMLTQIFPGGMAF